MAEEVLSKIFRVYQGWIDDPLHILKSGELAMTTDTKLLYMGDGVANILVGKISHQLLTSLLGGAPGEYYHLSQVQYNDLIDGTSTTLHYHAGDRDRANHTGTQVAATISDLDTVVADIIDLVIQDSTSIQATYYGYPFYPVPYLILETKEVEVDNEIPYGAKNGSNKDFYLGYIPNSNSLDFRLNGVQQTAEASEIVATNSKVVTSRAPESWEDVRAFYKIMRGATPMPYPPSAPTTLGLTVISATEIDLTWVDTSSNEDGFKIYWNTVNSKPGSPQATVGAGIEAYSATSLIASTLYYFWVEAYNIVATSTYINGSATTSPAGDVPVFWSKLESDSDVISPQISPIAGTVIGTPGYTPGKFGNGIDNPNAATSYANFGNIHSIVNIANPHSFCFWYKPDLNLFPLSTYKMLFFVGNTPSASLSHFQFWVHHPSSTIFCFVNASIGFNPGLVTNGINWSAGDDVFFGISLDPAGGKMNIAVGVNTADIIAIPYTGSSWTSIVAGADVLPGCYFGQNFTPEGVIDNLKIYDFYKTDWSDRFTEG